MQLQSYYSEHEQPLDGEKMDQMLCLLCVQCFEVKLVISLSLCIYRNNVDVTAYFFGRMSCTRSFQLALYQIGNRQWQYLCVKDMVH